MHWWSYFNDGESTTITKWLVSRTNTTQNITAGFLALGYLSRWFAYFLLLLCDSPVTEGPESVIVSRANGDAQSPPRGSVAPHNSAAAWRLARSQSVYCESGPAVRFSLRTTARTPELIPALNGFTGADRKQFIALTSSLQTARRHLHTWTRARCEAGLTRRSERPLGRCKVLKLKE